MCGKVKFIKNKKFVVFLKEEMEIKRCNNRIALILEDGNQYTYEQVWCMQNNMAKMIDKESLVCIFTDNDFGSVLGYLSCILNSHVALLLPYDLCELEIEKILMKFTPEYIWIAKKNCSEYIKGYSKIFEYLGYCLFQSLQKQKLKIHSQLQLLLYTSGSQGCSKLVRISKRNLFYNTASICDYLNLTENSRAISSLPISYTYGLSVLNSHLFCGGSIVITKHKVFQKKFWDLMKKYKITFFAGVPYTYDCLEKIGIGKRNLPYLQIMTQAGGKFTEKQQLYWGNYAKREGKKFFLMYGQTEATARISYLPADDCLRKLKSVGVAIPNCEIYIVNSNRQRVSSMIEGEIVCEGKSVSMGYAESRKELALGDKNNGILYTGDVGYKDDDGYIYITGRNSRFAKICGKRINLNLIEKIMEEKFNKEVVAISDDKKIFLYSDSPISGEEIKMLLEKVSFKVNIFETKSRTDLPLGRNGKIIYSKFQ